MDQTERPALTDTAREPKMAKVLFRIQDEAGTATETLWAEDVGGERHRIANIPFYAYGVSFDDIVYAPFSEADGFAVFERIVSKSGNRTIRIVLDTSPLEGRAKKLLSDIASLGCGCEHAHMTYVAVNIPPGTALDDVGGLIDASDLDWELADPPDQHDV